MSVCLTYLINLRGVILNRVNTHSHPLPPTPTHSHPPPTTPTHLQPTSFYFHSFLASLHSFLYHSYFRFMIFLSCFTVLLSLWCSKSSNKLRTKEKDILKMLLIFFKSLSWTFTISTCNLKMALLNHVLPTPIHIRLPKKKLKKVHTHLSFKSSPVISEASPRRDVHFNLRK